MSKKRVAAILSFSLLVSLSAAGITNAVAFSSFATTKPKAPVKAKAPNKVDWASAALAAKSAADASSAEMSAYLLHIDVFANAVPLYLAVASAYRPLTLTNFATLDDFLNIHAATYNDLQARNIDTGQSLDSLLNGTYNRFNAEIAAAAKVRSHALADYEKATKDLPANPLQQRAQTKASALATN